MSSAAAAADAPAAALQSAALRLLAAGDYDSAAACYTEALRVAPAATSFDSVRSVLYANRAACRLTGGAPDNAAALYDCDRAVEFNGAYVKARGRRAVVLERLGKLDEAIRGEDGR